MTFSYLWGWSSGGCLDCRFLFFRSIEPIGLVFSIEGDRIGPFGVAVVGCYFATSGEYCVHYSDIGGIAANAVYRT